MQIYAKRALRSGRCLVPMLEGVVMAGHSVLVALGHGGRREAHSGARDVPGQGTVV